MTDPEYRWSLEGALAAAAYGISPDVARWINAMDPADRRVNDLGELVYLALRLGGDWFLVTCHADRWSARRTIVNVRPWKGETP